MSRSTWSIYIWESGETYTYDGTIPRPNENMETSVISTQQKIRLADGSNAFVTPETKSIKEPFQMTIIDVDSTTRSQILGYINNGDIVKIVTHTSEEFIGKFIEMKRVWLTGWSPDQYDIQVAFEQMD